MLFLVAVEFLHPPIDGEVFPVVEDCLKSLIIEDVSFQGKMNDQLKNGLHFGQKAIGLGEFLRGECSGEQILHCSLNQTAFDFPSSLQIEVEDVIDQQLPRALFLQNIEQITEVQIESLTKIRIIFLPLFGKMKFLPKSPSRESRMDLFQLRPTRELAWSFHYN